MFPVMNSASKLNGYAFVILLAVMFMYSLPKFINYVEHEDNIMAQLADGTLMRNFEAQYDQEMYLRDISAELWGNIQYALFNEGLKGAVTGENGWVFTSEEYQLSSQYSETELLYRNKIDRISTLLANKGKKLIVLPVPMKVNIYTEHTKYAPNPKISKIYDKFTGWMQEKNISHVPLKQHFLENKNRQQLYFKRDTHWTPEGARMAADYLATRYDEIRGDNGFQTVKAGQASLKGDLLNYFRVSEWLQDDTLLAEPVQKYETVMLSAINSPVTLDVLFGDSTPPIVLVGTSYTKIEDWNFPGFVRHALRSDILTVANEAKGPFDSMKEFLESGLFDEEKIRTVIWEFPVRTLLSANKEDPEWESPLKQIFNKGI